MQNSAVNAKVLRVLRRTTSSGAYLPEVDCLRFIAILLVLIVHVAMYAAITYQGRFIADPLHSPLFSFIEHFGDGGVELFFAISGFILAVPFAAAYMGCASRPSLKSYYVRRLTRLEPPYVVAMVAIAALLVIAKHRSIADTAQHLLVSLFYGHGLIFGEKSTISFVAWSLEIEVQFYVLMPLLARLYMIRSCSRRRAVLVLAAGTIILVQQLVTARWQGRILNVLSLTLLWQLQFFMAGMYLADIYCANGEGFGPQTHAWDWVAAVGWPSLFALWCIPSVSAFVFPVAIVPLYCSCFRGPVTNSLARLPWPGIIGGMCYSIYLLHVQILGAIGPLFRSVIVAGSFGVTLLFQVALIGTAILLFCGVYFVLIEKPCMRRDWPRLLLGRIQNCFPVAARDIKPDSRTAVNSNVAAG
jgi:peptidoglycan/LPS O-acetylase OafA/YrhL